MRGSVGEPVHSASDPGTTPSQCGVRSDASRSCPGWKSSFFSRRAKPNTRQFAWFHCTPIVFCQFPVTRSRLLVREGVKKRHHDSKGQNHEETQKHTCHHPLLCDDPDFRLRLACSIPQRRLVTQQFVTQRFVPRWLVSQQFIQSQQQFTKFLWTQWRQFDEPIGFCDEPVVRRFEPIRYFQPNR